MMPVKGPRPYMDAALASLRKQEMGDDLEIHDGSLTSGDLMGETPVGMEEEQFMIDARCGLARHGWPLRRLQLTRLLDGSYMKSYFDTIRSRGRLYEDVVHGPHF